MHPSVSVNKKLWPLPAFKLSMPADHWITLKKKVILFSFSRHFIKYEHVFFLTVCELWLCFPTWESSNIKGRLKWQTAVFRIRQDGKTTSESLKQHDQLNLLQTTTRRFPDQHSHSFLFGCLQLHVCKNLSRPLGRPSSSYYIYPWL